MKAKKPTLTSRALQLLKHTPNMKPKDMAEKLEVPVQRIYAIRSKFKNTIKKINPSPALLLFPIFFATYQNPMKPSDPKDR